MIMTTNLTMMPDLAAGIAIGILITIVIALIVVILGSERTIDEETND